MFCVDMKKTLFTCTLDGAGPQQTAEGIEWNATLVHVDEAMRTPAQLSWEDLVDRLPPLRPPETVNTTDLFGNMGMKATYKLA